MVCCINKLPAKLYTIGYIVTATTPVPTILCEASLPGHVAGTVCQIPFATFTGYGMDYTGACYSIHEGCFFACWTWTKNKKEILLGLNEFAVGQV